MPRGGARAGAGRKAGGMNAKSRAIADRAAAEGITPLEVMLVAMREHFEKKAFDAAAAIAKDAAPYMHPRLASIEQRIEGEMTTRTIGTEPMTEAEWVEKYGRTQLATAGRASEGAH